MDESPWNESIHTNKSWADIRTPNTFPKSGDEKTCQILMTISSKCMLPFMIMDGTNNTYSTITQINGVIHYMTNTLKIKADDIVWVFDPAPQHQSSLTLTVLRDLGIHRIIIIPRANCSISGIELQNHFYRDL